MKRRGEREGKEKRMKVGRKERGTKVEREGQKEGKAEKVGRSKGERTETERRTK